MTTNAYDLLMKAGHTNTNTPAGQLAINVCDLRGDDPFLLRTRHGFTMELWRFVLAEIMMIKAMTP